MVELLKLVFMEDQTYLEPFMEIEKYYGVIRTFHAAGVHQHMYTNGTLATEENLRALGEALVGSWAEYRQMLRDLPQQEGWPLAIQWPTAPGSEEEGERLHEQP